MRRISIELNASDRQALAALRSKGTHPAREVNRAHILAALGRGLADRQIAEVLGVSRVVIWRTRSAFAEKGLDYALHDGARLGAPRQYGTDQEAEVVALACQKPPPGCKRWTLETLTSAARQRGPQLAAVSRETIRRWLKKTS
jgi:transposase